jgi:HK97 family phage major capsid protein
MALKALMLRKKIDQKKKELEALRAKDAEFQTREAELETAIAEAETDEEQRTVTEEIDSFNADKEAHETQKGDLEREVGELEEELAAEERAQDTTPPAKEQEEREDKKMATPEARNKFGLTEEFVQRENVQDFLVRVRDHISHKRALTNVGLTIPTEFLGILRENVINYSKLYRHVNVRYLSGEGRMVVMGTIPEAVWTECCATLNELSLGFNDVEVDCNKLGGYFAVCNAILEDSDINLASELLTALAQAIGYALDKAILYGTGTKMPLGVMTRLVQTAAPADYPATARTWVDLHTSNIKTHAASVTGADLFKAIVLDSGAAKGKYARGEKVWVMNETTYTSLMSQALVIDANGNIVSGIADRMPVIGGVIEVLNFIPDNVIIGGYFELYLLAERASTQLAQSEHCRFIEDQTVFKGTARYDGLPVIAEAFVAIGINGTTPNATMSFAPDTANTQSTQSGEG